MSCIYVLNFKDKVKIFICDFSEEGFLVGYKVVVQFEYNFKNIIYDVKRFIGKKYIVEELIQVQKRYLFKVSINNLILEVKEFIVRCQFVCLKVYRVILQFIKW